METRANYVLIGAFVLIAAAALMLFVVWIAKAPFSRNLDVYDVVFDGPVNGLGKGGEVRFNGIKVGEVSRLSLDRKDPNKVIARISVDAQTPVRVDSKAQLNFLGITGVTFIQILAGSPEKPMLQRTDPNVPAIILAEKTGLDQLLGGGQDILTNVSSALSPDNIAALTRSLANIQKITDKLAQDDGLIDTATVTLKSVNKAVTSIDAAAKTFNADFHALAVKADGALTDVSPAIADIRGAMKNINDAAAQINAGLAPNANRTLEQLALAAGDLRALMLRINALAGEIEQDPSTFVYQKPQPVERSH
jgi:phospholipid/cholesterol/gamma-HCH transport system substrate-binding protein